MSIMYLVCFLAGLGVSVGYVIYIEYFGTRDAMDMLDDLQENVTNLRARLMERNREFYDLREYLMRRLDEKKAKPKEMVPKIEPQKRTYKKRTPKEV